MGVSELESTYSFSDLLNLYNVKREKYRKVVKKEMNESNNIHNKMEK